MHWILLVTLPCLVVAQCISKDDNLQTNDSETSINFPKAQRILGLKLLKILNEIRPDQSTSFSPYTIFHNLLLSYFISDGDTAKQIEKVLFQSETQTKSETFRGFKEAKSSESKRFAVDEKDNDFFFANYMCYSKDEKAKKCIKKLLKDELVKVDFSNPSSDLAKINKFVSDFTNGKISNFLAADSVNKDSSLFLANANYFKRLWQTKFPVADTQKSLFHSFSSEDRNLDTMVQYFNYNYRILEPFDVQLVQLPFQTKGLSMLLMVSEDEYKGVNEFIKDLNEISFADIFNLAKLKPMNVLLELPRFTIEDTIDLKMPFKQMGLAELFEKNASFARLTGTKGENYLTGAIHRSKVEVDEKGESDPVSRPEVPATESKVFFTANRPFIYIIYDKSDENILSLGVFK